MENLAELIKAEAENLGFSFIAFSKVKQTPHFEAFRNWVNSGFHGSMAYLSQERTLKARQDPATLLENAKTMIVFGFRYNIGKNEKKVAGQSVGLIASYAIYEDYHAVLKRKARELITNINEQIPQSLEYRIFVDSAPIMEKDNAYMAGAGWIGRNSLLLSPKFGSFLFLGCIMTNLEIEPSQPFSHDLCGDCRKCIAACPTGCITNHHSINASQCISYLTIEHKGVVPRDLRSKMGKRVYGCDICQNVCPINRALETDSQDNQSIFKQLIPKEVDLLNEIQMDETAFNKKYGQTPVSRATYVGFKRNLIIALGNSNSSQAIPMLGNILQDDPSWLLRLHSAWALIEINTHDSRRMVREHLGKEMDDRVRKEIRELFDK